MGKLTMVVMLLSSIVIAMPMIHGINGKDTKEIENWFKMVGYAKQKLTKLHFYFHAIPDQGKISTDVTVAQANYTMTSPTLFGRLKATDYPLTEGPKRSSKLVGRAQGSFTFVSLTELSLSVSLTLVFPDGSTISTFGLNNIQEKDREMPIIGGSGIYRFAQGVVIFTTYSHDPISGNDVVEVNVLAMHY